MSSSTFWGGSGWLRGNEIRPLKATDFASFVKAYLDVPNNIACSRSDYHALPDTEQKRLKSSPYFTACSFKEGTTLRNDDNAEKLTMVSLDIDDPEVARPFVESPETVSDALWPFSFACYTTIGHTPERPKVRVVVPVENGKLEDRHAYVRGVADFLGMPSLWAGHRESNVASQPFARPCVFEDDPKDFSPVLASRPNGQKLQLLDLPARGEDELKAPGNYAYRGESEDSDTDLDHLPIRGLAVEDMREPLFKIDPDCSYKIWTEIGCALRHNFREEEEAEEAFFLYDGWSRSGDKYREGDTEAKWRSFRPSPKGKIPITLRSLFKYAMDAGWRPAKISNKLVLGFREWLASCEDPAVIIDEGAARIASQPFKNPLTDRAWASDMQKRLAALKVRVTDTAIIKDIAKARAVERHAADDGNLPGWLRPWVFVKTADQWFNIANGIELTPEAFNRTYMIELMSKDELAQGGRPSIMPCDLALNIKGRIVPKVDGVVYDPRWQGEEPFFEQDGKVYVNSYNRTALPALDEKNSAVAGKMLNRHLEKIIRERENQVTLLDWMAYIVQNPGRKIRWVPVLQGAQGCGKTMLLNVLGAAIGRPNIKLSNPGSTKSDFNDWAAGAQVVGIEEIRVKGTNRTEIMDKLKDLTTNDQVALNRKNKDVATIENVTNYIAFTNYHDALHLTEDDRRYFVVKCRIQSKAQKVALAAETQSGMPYFQWLALLLNKGGALRHFLMNHKISANFNPDGDAPDTVYRRQMIEESKGPLQLAVEDMVRSGEHPMIGKDLILYEDIASRTRSLCKSYETPSHFLYELGFQPFNGSQRFQVNGSRSQVWVHQEFYDEEFYGDPVAELKRRHDSISDENI